jgi:uncharacterized membrane protein (DUF485 family)
MPPPLYSCDGGNEGENAMPSPAVDRTRQILADPVFRELASERAKLRWGLSVVTLILFFGFIALISTARGTLGATVGGSAMPLGLVLALAVIVLVVLLTGFYVQRSNSRFDELARGLNRRFGQ